MAITILFGWWLVPLGITIAAFVWAYAIGDHEPSSGYGNIGKGLGNLLLLCAALIASIAAWLIWAVAS